LVDGNGGFCWIQNSCKRFAACLGVLDQLTALEIKKRRSDFST